MRREKSSKEELVRRGILENLEPEISPDPRYHPGQRGELNYSLKLHPPMVRMGVKSQVPFSFRMGLRRR